MLKTKAALRRKDDRIFTHNCEITKVVELERHQFASFQQDLLRDYPFITENIDAMGVDETASAVVCWCWEKSLTMGFSYVRRDTITPDILHSSPMPGAF